MAFIPTYYPSTFPAAFRRGSGYAEKDMPTLSASQNDYSLALSTTLDNGATVRLFNLHATTAIDITSIVAGAANTIIILSASASSATITLKNASGSGTAANRLAATTGADVSLTAGTKAVLRYDGGASRWVIAQSMNSSGFKLEVPGNTEGNIVLLDQAWWNMYHTGNRNNAGTKTAATGDVFYAYGLTVPATLTYVTNDSLPLVSLQTDRVQTPRSSPGIYLISSAATAVTVRFSKIETGYGLNAQ